MRVRNRIILTVSWPRQLRTSRRCSRIRSHRSETFAGLPQIGPEAASRRPHDNMKMSQEISEFKSTIVILEQAKEKAVTKANAHYAALEALNQEISELKDNLSQQAEKHSEAIADLNSQLESARESGDASLNQIQDQHKEALADKEQMIAELKSSKEQDKADFDGRFAGLQNEIAAHSITIEELNEQLRSSKDSHENEVAELKRSHEEFMGSSSDQSQRLLEEKEVLQKSLAEKTAEAGTLAQSLEILQVKFDGITDNEKTLRECSGWGLLFTLAFPRNSQSSPLGRFLRFPGFHSRDTYLAAESRFSVLLSFFFSG